MSRVFISQSTGAGVYIFSNDHCPPHVHARHRQDGWIARVRFSFLGDVVELMSIAPSTPSPLPRIIRRLVADIEVALPECRRIWWNTQSTTCLANTWALVTPQGSVMPCSENTSDAGQIGHAEYQPDQARLHVTFLTGKRMTMRLRS